MFLTDLKRELQLNLLLRRRLVSYRLKLTMHMHSHALVSRKLFVCERERERELCAVCFVNVCGWVGMKEHTHTHTT